MTDPLERATDFEAQFNSWFNSSYKDLIADSEAAYRMVLADAEEREERGLSALPSTKTVEVVDKAKEYALLEYHKDPKSLSYTATDPQDLRAMQGAHWLTGVVHYRMESPKGFPFFTWHDASLKAGFVDGMEAAFVYWKKESYKEKRTIFLDNIAKKEITEEQYNSAKKMYPTMQEMDPLLPLFEIAFTKDTIEETHVCRDTWWIDQLRPGINILWDFKAPMLDVNLGQICMLKVRKTVDEIMSYVDLGVFDKVRREEVEKYRSVESTSNRTVSDETTLDAAKDTTDLGDENTVEMWILFEKLSFRWKCSFSLEGKLSLAGRKTVDEVFYNNRRVNVLPVRIGYMDKALHDNIPRSLPQVIKPIEKQYTDHINNANDIAKNLARGGRIRLNPDHDVDEDDVLNGGIFKAQKDEVEFIQYNPGIMEAFRSADMTSAAMNAIAPAGVSAVNVAPKGTNKTLGVSQMIQSATDTKRYCQLMIRNETFLKPLLWIIAQLEFAFENNDMALRIAAAKVPGFQPPEIVPKNGGRPVINTKEFDFDVDVKIVAGLGQLPDVERFNQLMEFWMFLKNIGVSPDSMVFGRLGSTYAGFEFDTFKPQPMKGPPPKLDSKLNVSVDWLDLPANVQMMLVDKWQRGEVMTNSNIEGRLEEQLHNKGVRTAGKPANDMTGGSAAMRMSEGGQVGGQGGY